ncbi:MAG: cell division topological specificity factor MinE [Thermoanaerobacteraceae bacterium]|nr:cell division topological specificity factor MinE [Thermoanaerobacteraceae bacterium]
MGFFDTLSSKGNSKDVAKERLRSILVQDRTNVYPQYLDMIKNDIVKVISDYIEIDPDGLEIKIANIVRSSDNANIPELVANVPIKRMKNIGR